MGSVREPESAKSKAAKHQKRHKVTNKVTGAGHPQTAPSSNEKAPASTPTKGTPTKANGPSTPAH